MHNPKIGDRVEKQDGYRWPGVVVAVFNNLAGSERVVVECTVPEVAGALHIYSPRQLRQLKPVIIVEAHPQNHRQGDQDQPQER